MLAAPPDDGLPVTAALAVSVQLQLSVKELPDHCVGALVVNEVTAGGDPGGGIEPVTVMVVNDALVGVPSQLMPSRTIRHPHPYDPAVGVANDIPTARLGSAQRP